MDDLSSILDEFPDKLRKEALIYILEPTYKNIVYLRAQSHEFLSWVCYKLKPSIYS